MKPQLWICAGPNGAGKSTLVAERNDARLPIVNPDIIAAQSPNITPIAAGREALAQQKAFIEAKQSFIVETTLSGRREVELMKTAKEAGFKVNLAYVGVRNSSMSLFRVGTRVQSGGHNVPPEDIARRFQRSLDNLAPAMAVADRSYVLDNTKSKQRLILVQEDKKVRAVGRRIPAWAKPILDKSVRQGFAKSRERKEDRGR